MHFQAIKLYGAKRTASGFALIVTIILLAFLVLIAVALSSFVRVETQAADNTDQLTRARQNALVGLNSAVGQLQKYAGPDKRVSSKADITATPTNNQKQLTGIWDVSSPPVVQAWLVSGNETAPTGNSSVLDPATGNFPYDDTLSEVFVVGRKSVDSDADRVRLKKSPIDAANGSVIGVGGTPTVGHYAYWVGDEGVKGTIALPDPLLDTATQINYNNTGGDPGDDWSGSTNEKRERLNQLQLPRPRQEKIFTGIDFDVLANARILSRTFGREQIRFFNPAPTDAVRLGSFHSMTPLSEAVLTDVPNGRLKIDLSDPAGASAAGGGSYGDAVLDFRNFRLTPPATGFVATFRPRNALPIAAIGSTTQPTSSAGPVLSEFGVRFSFSLSGTNQVQVNYIVEAELWNPYAGKLELAASPNALRLLIENLPTVTLRDSTASVTASVNLADWIGNAPGGATPGRAVAPDSSLTWNAGAIKALSGGATLTSGGTPVTVTTTVNMPGATNIDQVDLPVVNNLKVTLEVENGSGSPGVFSTLQEYQPNKSFTGGNNRPHTMGVSPCLGYGYQFTDDIAFWTDGHDATHRDPRFSNLQGAFYDTAGSWDTDPINNGSVSPDGVLDTRNPIVLFDLPRQELVSIGDLRNLTNERPAPLGNGWGGAKNDFFDRYYFSTVPRNYAAWAFTTNEAVPNRYVRFYTPEDAPLPGLADLQSSNDAAKFLMVRGAFNINSTSVDAWKAVLGAKIKGWSMEGAAGTQNLDNVVFRLAHGAQQMSLAPLSAASLTEDEVVKTGGRQLTDAAITNLAQAIVGVLTTRGRPFTSVEDFLNFDDDSNASTPNGVIAIALGTASINDPSVPAGYRYTPGAVTQADIISQIAPFINVRSDTFLVRSYGDSENPVTGNIEGRAWCEAIVQRVPETVLASDNQITPTGPFGRKFKVISFRWLTSNDL